MILIQPLLIMLLLLGVVVYLRVFRSRLVDRIVVSAILVAALGLISFPDAANDLAHLVGVGRGADLLFYLTIPGLGFVVLLLFSRVRELDERLTKLTRDLALRSPHLPGDATAIGEDPEGQPEESLRDTSA